MTEEDLAYERKELSKAQNIGIFGIVGAFIPVLGLCLGVISLLSAGAVDPATKQLESKKKSVKTIASLAILLSLLAGAGYYALYHQRQVDARNAATRLEQEKQDAEQQKKFHENAVQSTLQYCLGQAQIKYQISWDAEVKALGRTDGTLPQYNANRQDGFLKDWKDDCYKAADAGDASHPLGF